MNAQQVTQHARQLFFQRLMAKMAEATDTSAQSTQSPQPTQPTQPPQPAGLFELGHHAGVAPAAAANTPEV